MAGDGSVMEASSVGLEEEGDEIELSLGLSIGGNFRKSAKLYLEEKKTPDGGADLSLENQFLSGHSMTQAFVGDSEAESGAEYTDPHTKREIHALRRQEARRKREEKLRKRGLMIGCDFSDDNVCLEEQRAQIRASDREMRDNEANLTVRECKGDKKKEREGPSLTATHNGAQNLGHGSSATAYGSIPVVPYPPLQFVPFANGFAYPSVIPCSAPTSSNGGNEKNVRNVQQPLACRSFWPSQGGLSSGNLVMGGSDSDNNRGKDGTNLNAMSNGSPVSSSSVVSENQRGSQQGSTSADTGSDSSHLKPEQSQLNSAREQSVPSAQSEPTQANSKTTTNTGNAVPSGIIPSSLTKLREQPDSETRPNPVNKSITSQNPNPGPSKVARDQGLDPPSLSQMPCVSTTGNGPNGKTITGFLYRYSKSEVSIVCVCHGSSFSPAEFVEHAGGKDITHPLRHITVIPSAFGS